MADNAKTTQDQFVPYQRADLYKPTPYNPLPDILAANSGTTQDAGMLALWKVFQPPKQPSAQEIFDRWQAEIANEKAYNAQFFDQNVETALKAYRAGQVPPSNIPIDQLMIAQQRYTDEIGKGLTSMVGQLATAGQSIQEFLSQVKQNYDIDNGAFNIPDTVVRQSDLYKLGLDVNVLQKDYNPSINPATSADTHVPAAPTDVSTVAPGAAFPADAGPPERYSTTWYGALSCIVWNDPLDADLNGIQIWRSTTDDYTTAHHIETVPKGKLMWEDSPENGLIAGETYYYWLRSQDDALNVSQFVSSIGTGVGGDQIDYNISTVVNNALDALFNNNTYRNAYKIYADSFQVIVASSEIDPWDSGTTYAQYEKAYYSGHYYQSLQDSNLNKNPATETSWWENIDDAIDTNVSVFAVGKVNGTYAVGIRGDLFVDGTITGTAIAATTITAGNIVAGTITGTEIASTTITASNIAAATITASQIKGTAFGSLTISSGTITLSSSGTMTISATDGIYVSGTGNLKLVTGADIDMYTSVSGTASINWIGQSYTIHQNSDYSGNTLAFWPDTTAQCSVMFGVQPDSTIQRLQYITGYASNGIYFGVRYSDASTAYNGYLALYQGQALLGARYASGTNMQFALIAQYDEIEISGASTMYMAPYTNKGCDLGTASYAFDDCYADDFTNVADFFFLDTHDDLAELKKIKGSGVIDDVTGLELIDDNTIPAWMIHKKKKDMRIMRRNQDTEQGELVADYKKGDPVYTSDGRPYLSFRTCISLAWGACRQLDDKYLDLEKRLAKLETKA